MNPEKIERFINEISWGGKYIEVRDNYGRRSFCIIKPISIRERNFVDFIKERSFQDAVDAGLMTKFELYKEYKRRGIWTSEDDDNIEIYKKRIDELEGTTNKIYQRELQATKESLAKLKRRREALYVMSAENYAEQQQTLALIYCATYDEQENKKWSNWQEFLEYSDDGIVSSIIKGFKELKNIGTKDLRAVARSGPWRFRWNGAKSIGDLFGKPISDFDSQQQALLYWSQVYDSVYESMEKPPDHVINDDDALDKWFEDQDKKRKRKEIERGKGQIGRMGVSDRIGKHGEIGIVANPAFNPNAPKLEEVHSLNPELVRNFRREEEKRIKESNNINEKDLRSRKNKIARKLIGSKDAVIGSDGFGQGRKSKGKVYEGGTI